MPAYCGDCSTCLPDVSRPEEITPCPKCGSTARRIEVEYAETMHIHVHTGALQRDGEGRDIGFSESERLDGVATGATASSSGISQLTIGKSSHNETDAKPCCERLVRFLRARGVAWSEPIEGEADVDLVSSAMGYPDLSMQVVRANTDQNFWAELTRTNRVEFELDCERAAQAVWEAIAKKERKVPVSHRGAITLVLDANRTPGFALSPVVDTFEKLHGAALRALGFAGVYIVGPDDQLVRMLA